MNIKAAEWYAILLTVIGAIALGFLMYVEIPEANKDYAQTILGFILGTVLTTAINFMIGTSKSSQDKTDILKGNGNDRSGE